MRPIGVVTAASLSIAISCALQFVDAHASFGIAGSSVGCIAGSSAAQFDGACIVLEGPSAPTRPSLDHPWAKSPPTAQPACTPYDTTIWAAAAGTGGDALGGAVWSPGGQRIPIVYSTPITDWGWVYSVYCGSPGVVRFVRVVSAARTPSPCPVAAVASECLPGLDPSSFLAAVEGQVPPETIAATPPRIGVAGIPVEVELIPAQAARYAEIDLTVPDAGDGDPGELLHVVWVVEAIPESVFWTWPDGSSSDSGRWIPQSYIEVGSVRARLVYQVTAEGFWSDGVTVHHLTSVSVGTITVSAQLAYSVEQVQPGLG